MARESLRSRNVIKPTQDTTGVHVWLILWKAYRSVAAKAAADIGTQGLGMSDFGVLECVLHKGPTPVNAIGPRIGLTSGSISTAVDRLEQRGLVSRRLDAQDARARAVHLTASGRRLIERAFARHREAMEKAAGALDQEERRRLVELLKKLGKS